MNFSLFVCALLATIYGVQSQSYLGCYIDAPQRDVSGLFLVNSRLTLNSCLQGCQSRGFRFASLQYS